MADAGFMLQYIGRFCRNNIGFYIERVGYFISDKLIRDLSFLRVVTQAVEKLCRFRLDARRRTI